MTLDERLYYDVLRVRRVEETIAEIYPTDKIRSPVHLSIGQEAVSVGVCSALRSTDKVFGSYRCHALYLAKGGDLKAMIAELYGKATGCCGGWGGSMHLVDPDAGLVATSAIVASTVPLAVGYAYAEKLRGRDTIVAVFFGDGALEEGVWHEAVNFARLHGLRVLFVCEDNGYAVHLPLSDRQPRPIWYGLRSGLAQQTLMAPEAADPAAVIKATKILVELLPAFLYCQVHRWRAHVGPGEDWTWGYREKPAELPDAVAIAGARVESARRAELDGQVEAEIKEAVQCAEESAWPNL